MKNVIRKKITKVNRGNLLTKITKESSLLSSRNDELPVFFKRKLQAYNFGAVFFVLFGIISVALIKTWYGIVAGVFLSLCMVALSIMEKKEFNENGFETWKMEVLQHTYTKSLRPRISGMYAQPLDGEYVGKMCHIAIDGGSVAPPEGRLILLTVPGKMSVLPVRDIYYIPKYYALDLL